MKDAKDDSGGVEVREISNKKLGISSLKKDKYPDPSEFEYPDFNNEKSIKYPREGKLDDDYFLGDPD